MLAPGPSPGSVVGGELLVLSGTQFLHIQNCGRAYFQRPVQLDTSGVCVWMEYVSVRPCIWDYFFRIHSQKQNFWWFNG